MPDGVNNPSMAVSQLPDPPVPSHADCRSNEFFPLYHKRLRQSAFWLHASSDAKAISVDFWCESYEQVPAGSLPNDDLVLSDKAGFGRRDLTAWLAIKDEVMAPWTLCSDGRWYHLTMVEIVLDAMGRQNKARQADRERKAKWRAEQKEKARGTKVDVPRDTKSKKTPENKNVASTPALDVPDVPDCPASTGEDITGQGQDKTKEEILTDLLPTVPACDFDLFWSLCVRKVGKDKAKISFNRGVTRIVKEQKCTKAQAMEQICEAMRMAAPNFVGLMEQGKTSLIPHPATWLNQGRWNDDVATERRAVDEQRIATRGRGDQRLDDLASFDADVREGLSRRRFGD